MKPGETLSMWTVYDHPKDYPDVYVARRFEIGNGPEPRPTNDMFVSESLDDIRQELALHGLVCLMRSDGDDPKIVETWL